jgi:ribosomal protein L37AE/L43A
MGGKSVKCPNCGQNMKKKAAGVYDCEECGVFLTKDALNTIKSIYGVTK